MDEILLEVCENKDFKKGDVIFNQEDKADGMYVIKSGKVDVERDDMVIATLEDGDFFGEMGLMLNEKRSATIRAVSDNLFTHFLSKVAYAEVKNELGAEVTEKALQRYSQTYKNALGES